MMIEKKKSPDGDVLESLLADRDAMANPFQRIFFVRFVPRK